MDSLQRIDNMLAFLTAYRKFVNETGIAIPENILRDIFKQQWTERKVDSEGNKFSITEKYAKHKRATGRHTQYFDGAHVDLYYTGDFLNNIKIYLQNNKITFDNNTIPEYIIKLQKIKGFKIGLDSISKQKLQEYAKKKN